MNVEESTKNWYEDYYRRKGADRNDLLNNPEVLFQYLAQEASVVAALRSMHLRDRANTRILDVGCGTGTGLSRFVHYGFSPSNLYGIDVLGDLIVRAQHTYPNLNFIQDDAGSMPFETGAFDLVLESTMFVQLTDEQLAQRIAGEMLRVAKPGGHILLVDWRYPKPFDPAYRAVSRSRIRQLFGVGSSVDVVCRTRGALIPPLGRSVSRLVPSVYFLLAGLFPFLVAAQSTVLRKRDGLSSSYEQT